MRHTNKAKPQETQHCINNEENTVNEERKGERNVLDLKVSWVMRDLVKDWIKLLGKRQRIKPLKRVYVYIQNMDLWNC